MDDQTQSLVSEPQSESLSSQAAKRNEVVSTHVLVREEQVQRLKDLSRRTRIHQSDYLREAVEDLLVKYGKAADESDK